MDHSDTRDSIDDVKRTTEQVVIEGALNPLFTATRADLYGDVSKV